MGWSGSPDTQGQVTLYFAGRAEAVAFADKHGLSYCVVEPQDQAVKPKSYADNFRHDRVRS